MAPKRDIRSFFGAPAAKKPAPAKKEVGGGAASSKDQAGPGSAKSKFFEEEKPASKAIEKKPPPKKPPPAKATPTKKSPAKAKPKPGKATPKKSAPKPGSKRKNTIDDDDSDEPFEVSESGSDESAMVDLAEEDDTDDSEVEEVEEVMPKKKKRALPKSATATPKSPPKPASAAKKAKTEAPTAKAPKSAAKRAPLKDASADLSAGAKEAIAAVDAVAGELPPNDEVKYTTVEPSGFGGGVGEAPPNAGTKDTPRGHPDCLTGKTFVITGTLDSLTREEAEDIVKRHGGRITGSVSGRTNFLVVGTGSGPSKVRAGKEKGVRFIDEDGLFSLIRAAPAPKEETKPPPAARPPRSAGPASSGPSSSKAAAGGSSADNGQLWVDKYKPTSPEELVGNNQLVLTLKIWLSKWEDTNIKGLPPPPAPGTSGAKRDMSKRAVLLSGPPGLGKTTSAHVISRALGLDPVEVNASDTRSKADTKIRDGVNGKLSNVMKELSTNRSIGMGMDTNTRKQVIVMDEVDGMSGGDRGGVTELIGIIKATKVPIICICNDKYAQKLKSLRNHCLELEFRKPTKQQVAKRMASICAAEGLSMNAAALEAVCEGGNGDIRLVLGQLQMLRLRATAVSFDDAKKSMSASKDPEMSPFEAARKLLEPASKLMKLNARADLVFQDLDLVPLLVQENYLNHRPTIAGANEAVRLKVLAKAADAISTGDIINTRVRMHQAWNLMPTAATLGVVYPAAYVSGPREVLGLHPGEFNFPRFTAWLGSNSTKGKQSRLLGELSTRMQTSGEFSAGRQSVRLDYAPALRPILTKPLTEGVDGIPAVLDVVNDYCIAKDEFDFILDVTQWKSKKPWNADPYKGVETKVKSALTRQINATRGPAKTSIMVEEFKRGPAKKKITKRAAKLLDNADEFLNEEDAAVAAAPMDVDDEEDEEDIKEGLKHVKGLEFEEKKAPSKGRGAKKTSGAKKPSGRGRGKK